MLQVKKGCFEDLAAISVLQFSRAKCFMSQFTISLVHVAGECFSVGQGKAVTGCLSSFSADRHHFSGKNGS